MRYFEIKSGVSAPVFNEEAELIEKILESGTIKNTRLNIREQEIARKLVSRGLLERVFIDETEHFKFNDVEDVYW